MVNKQIGDSVNFSSFNIPEKKSYHCPPSSEIMKIILINTLSTAVALCNSAEYGFPNVHEFLASGRLNYGFNGSVYSKASYIFVDGAKKNPPPVSDMAKVEIPLFIQYSTYQAEPFKLPKAIRDKQ